MQGGRGRVLVITCCMRLLCESTKTMDSALAACQPLPHSLLHLFEPLRLGFGSMLGPARAGSSTPRSCPASEKGGFTCMLVRRGQLVASMALRAGNHVGSFGHKQALGQARSNGVWLTLAAPTGMVERHPADAACLMLRQSLPFCLPITKCTYAICSRTTAFLPALPPLLTGSLGCE